MAKDNTTPRQFSKPHLHGIETTSDQLTGRAGLSLFVRYVQAVGILSHLERLFGSLRKNSKGQPVPEIFKQLFCFLLDGTSRGT